MIPNIFTGSHFNGQPPPLGLLSFRHTEYSIQVLVGKSNEDLLQHHACCVEKCMSVAAVDGDAAKKREW